MRVPVFAYVLLKLAARCNIKCTYCYWFRDHEVYEKPSVLTPDVEAEFCKKLENHVREYELDTFTILFHGGEPLLFPKHRFQSFMTRLKRIERRTGCRLDCIISTNGILVDPGWVELFRAYDIGVCVSIDGPPDIHDRRRLDFRGHGTYGDVLRGFDCLTHGGLKPGVIAVCDPATDPARLIKHIVEELGVDRFDILPPDATHEDAPVPIDDYFMKLFDAWLDTFANRGVRIRILDGIIQGLVGNSPVTDSIGYGPVHTVTVLTDGSLEPLDVLRIAGIGNTKTRLNIFQNTFQDVQNDPVWMEAFEASLRLCDVCRSCDLVDTCGGGHLAHRWSAGRRYDNPSVYCASWKRIFEHTWTRISPTLIMN